MFLLARPNPEIDFIDSRPMKFESSLIEKIHAWPTKTWRCFSLLRSCCEPPAPPHSSPPLPLSPSAGGFLVLSQKKISCVTWLKWQTKIPSPSCSTDPLLPGRPGGRGRRQRGGGGGGGGGGAPPGRLQSLTSGPLFFFFFFLVLSFVDGEPRRPTVAPRDFNQRREGTDSIKNLKKTLLLTFWLLRTRRGRGVEGKHT